MEFGPLTFFQSDPSYGFKMISAAFSSYVEPAISPYTHSFGFFIFQIVLIIFTALFLVGIVHVMRQTSEVNKKLNKGHNITVVAKEKARPDQWEVVLKHMASENPAEWRLAIIEADTLLEEVLKRMGCRGETTGEMLKSLDRSSLHSLDDAWAAHKVRNLIAHKGSSYRMSQRDARQTVRLFENVFKEMEVI